MEPAPYSGPATLGGSGVGPPPRGRSVGRGLRPPPGAGWKLKHQPPTRIASSVHEVAIAEGIVQAVRRRLAELALPQSCPQTPSTGQGQHVVTQVGVQIGALTMVCPEALMLAFEVVTTDTELQGAELQIEEVPVSVRCRDCSAESEVSVWGLLCPRCGSVRIEVLRGEELNLTSVDIAD